MYYKDTLKEIRSIKDFTSQIDEHTRFQITCKGYGGCPDLGGGQDVKLIIEGLCDKHIRELEELAESIKSRIGEL